MSKLYKHKILLSVIQKQIDISILSKHDSKVKFQSTPVEDDYKRFKETTQIVINKVKEIFSTTYDYLEETKEAQTSDTGINTVYLKIWKFLVHSQNWSTVNQIRFILARFQTDIKV